MNRLRRTIMGAKVELYQRKDGTIRVKVDHPSNDPGLEIAITGLIVQVLGRRPAGPLIWRDDP